MDTAKSYASTLAILGVLETEKRPINESIVRWLPFSSSWVTLGAGYSPGRVHFITIATRQIAFSRDQARAEAGLLCRSLSGVVRA